jgi:hypothetical protein
MDSEYIGSIQIFDDCSTIDLPDEMPINYKKNHRKKITTFITCS